MKSSRKLRGDITRLLQDAIAFQQMVESAITACVADAEQLRPRATELVDRLTKLDVEFGRGSSV